MYSLDCWRRKYCQLKRCFVCIRSCEDATAEFPSPLLCNVVLCVFSVPAPTKYCQSTLQSGGRGVEFSETRCFDCMANCHETYFHWHYFLRPLHYRNIRPFIFVQVTSATTAISTNHESTLTFIICTYRHHINMTLKHV